MTAAHKYQGSYSYRVEKPRQLKFYFELSIVWNFLC